MLIFKEKQRLMNKKEIHKICSKIQCAKNYYYFIIGELILGLFGSEHYIFISTSHII